MPLKNETKHQAFIRLMTRRLERTLHELRLVSRLACNDYENSAAEAEEVITILDDKLCGIAKDFGVPYSTAIGAAASRAIKTNHMITTAKAGKIDEVDIVKAMELIKAGKSDEALVALKAALLQEAR